MFDQKEYNRRYYQRHKDRIKKAANDRHHRLKNDPNYRASRQLSRDLQHFGVPRSVIMRKTDSRCFYCGKPASDVHHTNDDGRTLERQGKQPSHDHRMMVPVCKACHLDLNRANMRLCMKTRANGYWSKTHECCVECGTTDRKHHGHGLCINCAARARRRNKETGV